MYRFFRRQSVSTVYSVRIPKALKEALEKLDGIDWQGELRAFLEKKVRRELMVRQIEEGRRLRSTMKAKVNSAELLREDREDGQ